MNSSKMNLTRKRSSSWLWILLVGIIIGAGLLFGTNTLLHKTSDTEFCVSCHSMQQPLAEYQGSIHFQNTAGIRAECSDCHVPHEPLALIKAKVLALKDVYGEITGIIDSQEKYEQHKLAMAQSVWQQLKETDSATCRSCHSFAAMDVIGQRPEARLEHPVAMQQGQTCIDCHKGVAHILPDMSELSAAGASQLATEAAKTADDVTTRYTISTQPFYLNKDASQQAGNLMPSTQVTIMKTEGDKIQARVDGWQQDGVNEVIYAAQGRRILSVLLGDDAKQQLQNLDTITDPDTGLVWNKVALTIWLPKQHLISDQNKIWQYASDMMSANCTGCHGLTALDRFNANQWIGVIKGMASRTSLSEEELRVLTQYVQKNANDMPKESQ